MVAKSTASPALRNSINRGHDVIARTYLMTAIGWIAFGTTVSIVSQLLYLLAKKRPRQVGPENSSKRPNSSAPHASATSRYHAVSIWPCLEACPAAWRMKNQPFLSTEAPALPLAACNQETCKCRYRHYSDRRDGEDRRNRWGRTGGLLPHSGEDDCRCGYERRTEAGSN